MPFWDNDGTTNAGWADATAGAAKPAQSYTTGGPDGGTYGPASAPASSPQPITLDEYKARIKPGMLNSEGKFNAPTAGVNFMLEGLTPEQAYATAHGISSQGDWSDDNRLGKPNSQQQADALLDPSWRQGPDNGGGVIGGVARAVGNTATGIAHNPALMAGITAGIGQFLAPATVGGDVSAATQLGGNADKAALFGNAGYGADPTMLQSFIASPYSKPLMNAGKSIISGGSPMDAIRSAAGSYAGEQASGIIGSSTGMNSIGNIGGSVVSSVIKGSDPLKALISSGANAAASEITGNIDGFSELPPSQQSFINSMVSSSLKGKTPTKSLIDGVTQMANGQVSKSKPTTNTTTGGWSA